ncbi:alkene reductase [Polynucleobacter sphagniphilus]|uniref:alkene reductase n=1 Tax=Polynucleobacter sphagniphilus TaxID=1743169 RepID=UPI00096BA180|nr:alkene reductase [Polynucleobacter sphagniphilus]MDF9787284.1 N-ethylmaleimide reductase [Polynucleobacter sphagniphilus]MDH6154346.1 N-ethylmaleimide reductase [Polynucleobacter sphagniphilus]MDH6240629.1 N-ethylmaleimide reductase [Polynucleobacter sphagniphilus]MDH6248088.1 N-ethylmaleimide reductase [Polynucleobacter sphagniphilus]MDH6420602.1 N-ethylmaleimide reductase [Polynucleobacter sphagniphilus]
MSATEILFTPVKLGSIELKNRLVMAPLTRMRAVAGDVPNPLAVEYYAQRASAGLIITEATQISPLGMGYPATPGIYSADQTAAWKKIVEAVHAKGGTIVAQLWHVGRISHSSLHPEQGVPVAPSAIAPAGQTYGADWQLHDYETPKAMTTEDIASLIKDYELAAINAKAAGFDGVEIHSANGYLLDQFLQDKTNQRVDQYGGSIENRLRLLGEVIDAVAKVFSTDRIGVRLSPYGTFNDIGDSDPIALFSAAIEKLNGYQLAYVHMIEPRSTSAGGNDQVYEDAPLTSEIFRNAYQGKFITAGGYDKAMGEKVLEEGLADAVAYGRLYISNPDLVERFKENAPLNPYNRATFYGGAEVGYTDYPTL